MTQPANGQAPAASIVAVQGSITLETATAAAYLRAKAANPAMTIAPPLGGYRSFAMQAALKANPSAYGSSLRSSQIAAAGHSTHGYGTCVDIAAGNAWFQTNCGRFGFVRESPAGENNHYRFTAPTWAVAAAPVPANIRRPTVAVNTHVLPSVPSAKTGTIQKGVATAMSGFTKSALKDGTYNGSNLWYQVAATGNWALVNFFDNINGVTGVPEVPSPVDAPVPVVATPPAPVVTPPAPAPAPVVTPPASTQSHLPPLDPKIVLDPSHMEVPLPVVKKPVVPWYVLLLQAIFAKH